MWKATAYKKILPKLVQGGQKYPVLKKEPHHSVPYTEGFSLKHPDI